MENLDRALQLISIDEFELRDSINRYRGDGQDCHNFDLETSFGSELLVMDIHVDYDTNSVSVDNVFYYPNESTEINLTVMEDMMIADELENLL